MKIAIHNSQQGFHPRWVDYCEKNNIPYKLVNCYKNDIIKQLEDCNALMWHHSHIGPKDILFAKQLLFSLEQTGLIVFPDYNSNWHFDDKVGQKYLLESVNAPLVPSFVFYNKKEASDWISTVNFPLVWKLRGGAGSSHVKLIYNASEANRLIKKSFGKGFKQYDRWSSLKERWRKYSQGLSGISDPIKGVLRYIHIPEYAKNYGRSRGYIYFQEFVPNNKFDTRVIAIDGKAFAIKRYVRKNDFRASGSGNFSYSSEEFDERCVQIALNINKKLKAQCVAYDFIFDKNNQPIIVEISYGFSPEGYDSCPGYWDKYLHWHDGVFNPYGWMVDLIIKEIHGSKA